MWGESIWGGSGDARRVGRRDCRTCKAVTRRNVSILITWEELSGDTNSCPTSSSAYLLVHLPAWQQAFGGADLSW